MNGPDNDRFKSGGLPRHSFVEDPFFRGSQASANMFRDFDNPAGGRNTHHFGSNPRLFDDNFFENFSRGVGRPFENDSSFFRSSLPRRPINNDSRFENSFRPLNTFHRSPSQPPTTEFHNTFPTSQPGSNIPPNAHKRQSSTGSTYDNFPSVNRTNSGNSQPEKVHIIHINQEKQPREHHASNSNIVEINNANSDGYTNGKLNPDRQQHLSKIQNESSSKIPVVCVEDYTNKTNVDNKLLEKKQAISDKPIPLPPPESIIKKETSDEYSKNKKTMEINEEKSENVASVVEAIKKLEATNDDNDSNDHKTNVSNNSTCMKSVIEQIIHLLDNTERRVEQLRENAAQLEMEKESILDILNNIRVNSEFVSLEKGDQEDLILTADHLLKRCKAVDVVVNTPRNEDQTRALAEVNALIDAVISTMQENVVASREKMERFLNACSPDEPPGPIDQHFQTRIVECTADDQKKDSLPTFTTY